MLRELGIEEDDLQFAGSYDHGTFQLTEKYISRVEATLIAWFTNILEVGTIPLLQARFRSTSALRSLFDGSLAAAADITRLRHETFHKRCLF